MDTRGHESPMDFEWQTHGPADATSPFHKLAMEHMQNERKRTHSDLKASEKPSAPPLRAPDSQPFLFSQFPPPLKPLASSYRTPSFTTPQKKFEVDFSSGPENASSPDNADNDDTPEAPKPGPVKFAAPVKDLKPAGKRNSLFGLYGRFAPSAGGSDAVKSAHGKSLIRRVHERRRREQNLGRQLVRARRPSDDTSEDDEPVSPAKDRTNPVPAVHEIGYMSGLFTFIESYPNAPSLLAKYLQLFFNAAIILGLLFAIYSFWTTIQADVDRASEDAAAETLAEMAACAKSFVDNRCAGDARLPALETVCSNWDLCMNRDPNSVKRAKLSAHTFAEILNSFVEPISLKTLVFAGLVVVFLIGVSNATFGFLRRSPDFQDNNHSHPSSSLATTVMYPPPHPQHQHQSRQRPPPPSTSTPGHMQRFRPARAVTTPQLGPGYQQWDYAGGAGGDDRW